MTKFANLWIELSWTLINFCCFLFTSTSEERLVALPRTVQPFKTTRDTFVDRENRFSLSSETFSRFWLREENSSTNSILFHSKFRAAEIIHRKNVIFNHFYWIDCRKDDVDETCKAWAFFTFYLHGPNLPKNESMKSFLFVIQVDDIQHCFFVWSIMEMFACSNEQLHKSR